MLVSERNDLSCGQLGHLWKHERAIYKAAHCDGRVGRLRWDSRAGAEAIEQAVWTVLRQAIC